MELIQNLKDKLKSTFAMKDLGCAKKILGMITARNRAKYSLRLHQKPYLEKLVKIE